MVAPPRHSLSDTKRDIRKTGIHPDFWYPIARSYQLKPGKTLAVSFAGEPIVLVRTHSGGLFALENRCAHRQVPLDTGVVGDNCLQCGYHGWTYKSDGKCMTVPYLPNQRDRPNGVRNYPCRDVYGLIFIFPGDPAQAETAQFPDLSNHYSPNYKTRNLDRKIECHYSFLHENLMDMNHQFLHRRLMGGIKSIYLGQRLGDSWIEVDYTFKRVKGGQNWGEKFILQKTSQERQQQSQGKRDLMTIRTDYPYQRLKFWTAGSKEPAMDLWIVYVPLDRQQRTNHTFGLMMIRRPNPKWLMELLWPFIIRFTEGILAEDREIVEQEQQAFDRQGADWNQEIFPVIRNVRDILISQGLPLQTP
ncbi:MAG: aromatic ring-hydroxylating dioxygenase subunit alpha [Cyanobacteria bacterium P01_E01_bin.34]